MENVYFLQAGSRATAPSNQDGYEIARFSLANLMCDSDNDEWKPSVLSRGAVLMGTIWIQQ